MPITSKDTYTIIKTDASVSDGALVIFGIPLKTRSAYDALVTAKRSYGADALVNVTLENKSYWITILPIVTYSKISIRGDAIKFNRERWIEMYRNIIAVICSQSSLPALR